MRSACGAPPTTLREGALSPIQVQGTRRSRPNPKVSIASSPEPWLQGKTQNPSSLLALFGNLTKSHQPEGLNRFVARALATRKNAKSIIATGSLWEPDEVAPTRRSQSLRRPSPGYKEKRKIHHRYWLSLGT